MTHRGTFSVARSPEEVFGLLVESGVVRTR